MYDAYYLLRSKTAGLLSATILVLWIMLSVLPVFFGIGRPPLAIQTIFAYIASRPNLLSLLAIPIHRATMFAYASGLVSAALLLLLLLVIDGMALSPKSSLKNKVRRVADGTFILYLFHYPLLLLAAYAGLFHYHQDIRNVAVVSAIALFCVALAAPLDRLKLGMRRWLRAVVPD